MRSPDLFFPRFIGWMFNVSSELFFIILFFLYFCWFWVSLVYISLLFIRSFCTTSSTNALLIRITYFSIVSRSGNACVFVSSYNFFISGFEKLFTLVLSA